MVKMLLVLILATTAFGCTKVEKVGSAKSTHIVFADDEVPNYLVVSSAGKLSVQVDTTRMKK